ncbi:MAG TPA: acyl-CoA dehydrogenase [Candidatus Marinimicrobia bacterium]|nr:MAG: acyl-CoA dehydrogenase [Candidatus Marinimicrobia bacterium CG1_02_48_14]PIZ62470.1 MAG: acyl-CoA dehydrogenase [Candidatus Marinimicrobia bacterium CG_4_10_14_0_2_um_filter_48_9]PJA54324.1 MAG: acyl-CoA dehydrogenase [Candidatus Marinimicrobia bacterium CG_4_9_14_3_um_filter_48_9]HCW75484.1 acyl-CoA dehydrogenase [Candidatus Neomarinimicrobiota bacterium]
MNFQLNEEQMMIRDTIREFAETEIKPGVRERDEKAEFPTEIVRHLGELGFMGMQVPEEYGGTGLDTVSYAIALEEVARIDASTCVIMSVNNSLFTNPILKFGSEELKQKYLPQTASGDKLGAYSLSEPQSGSDAKAMLTTATKDGDHYILNGTKNWVTNGSTSDFVVVFAKTDKTAGHRGISAFVVEKGLAGFNVGKKEDKLGIRGSDTCELNFENCRVPAANLIGSEGIGFKIALATLDAGRIGIAAQAVGIAQGALERAIKYANEREQFGQKIGEFQGVSFKLADMATRIEASRLLVRQAAWMKDAGIPIGAKASMAKMYSSDTAMYVTTEAVQIHGGYGYIREFEVERMMRDAKITQIYEGTNEIQRLVISRHLLNA